MRKRALVVLWGLLIASAFVSEVHARGNIWSAKAIKALEALVTPQGTIAVSTTSSGNVLVADSKNVVVPGGVIQVCDTSEANCINLTREGAAIVQLGADVNGAAVAQTLKAHDGITGTDVAGANFTITGGRGTGAGAPGNVRAQTSIVLGTGTTAQTLADRMIVVGKAVTLADAAATGFLSVPVASNTTTGGLLIYNVEATENTNWQSRSGSVGYAITNNGGTEVCVFATAADADNTPTGTLTVTFDCDTTGTNVALVRATADSSLTAPTIKVTFTVFNNGGTGALAPQ